MRFPSQDVLKKWGKNALIFAGPAIIVLLATTAENLPKDAQWGIIVLYVVNVLTDLIRKFIAENQKK